MTQDLPLPPQVLAEFKQQLRLSREQLPDTWEGSRRLVGKELLPATISQLIAALQTSDLDKVLKEKLIVSLEDLTASGLASRHSEGLKRFTGLPTSKALRALCVLLKVGQSQDLMPACSNLSPEDVEQFLHQQTNPYDLLRQTETPSLLDLGAGDLSFAVELAEQYVSPSTSVNSALTLHCLERLKPGSKLGSLLHASHGAVQTLRAKAPDLQFRFWGDQDMFQLHTIKHVLPQYTIATCHAPATPTFAYEPSRVAPTMIDEHLRRTKGQFHRTQHEGEAALEVQHGDRALIFPPWKFDVLGPLALLNLLAQRAQLVVMGAIDNEVFWEILAQLVEDPNMRPKDYLFTDQSLPEVFGQLYSSLMSLSIGGTQDLSKLTKLRQSLPPAISIQAPQVPMRFRAVHIRRGSVFKGIPTSQTAKLFKEMKDEVPPWMITLVPEAIVPGLPESEAS